MPEKEIAVKLEKEKETSNTYRYRETDDTPGFIGTLYLRKFVAKQLGNPDIITVTIKA